MTLPWMTPEWIENRKKKLEEQFKEFGFNFCIKCGSKEEPFIMQHPPFHEQEFMKIRYFSVVNVLERKMKEKIELTYDEYLDKNLPKKIACPNCKKASNILERKSITPKYRCCSCFNQFDIPIFSFKKNSEYFRLLRNYRQELKAKYSSEIIDENKKLREALLQKYISLKDAKICCKKCAYMEDIHGRRLCVKCKQNYHDARYPTCFFCKPKSDEDDNDLGIQVKWACE